MSASLLRAATVRSHEGGLSGRHNPTKMTNCPASAIICAQGWQEERFPKNSNEEVRNG